MRSDVDISFEGVSDTSIKNILRIYVNPHDYSIIRKIIGHSEIYCCIIFRNSVCLNHVSFGKVHNNLKCYILAIGHMDYTSD